MPLNSNYDSVEACTPPFLYARYGLMFMLV